MVKADNQSLGKEEPTSAGAPPIGQLSRMLNLDREILETSTTSINRSNAVSSIPMLGAYSFTKKNLVNAHVFARVFFDPELARRATALFERHRRDI